MGPLAFDRNMSRVPRNQISEFASNRKWVKSGPEIDILGVKSGFFRVYGLLQQIKVKLWGHLHSTGICQWYLETKLQNLVQNGSGSNVARKCDRKKASSQFSKKLNELNYKTTCIQQTYVQGTLKPNFII